MVMVQIIFAFEFWDSIETLLDDQALERFLHLPRVRGRDAQGKHYDNQVFPGSLSLVQVQLEDDRVDDLFAALREFRDARPAHRHLQALVMPVKRCL